MNYFLEKLRDTLVGNLNENSILAALREAYLRGYNEGYHSGQLENKNEDDLK